MRLLVCVHLFVCEWELEKGLCIRLIEVAKEGRPLSPLQCSQPHYYN